MNRGMLARGRRAPLGPRAASLGSVAAALLILAGVWGCGRAERRGQGVGGDASLEHVGGFQVSIENKPARPRVGDNVLTIAVRDSIGRPVRGAEVRALVVMHAMGAMPRMESRGAVREIQPGLYEAKYGLAMAGEWDVEVAIRSTEGTAAQASYRLSTSTKDILFVSGTQPADVSRRAVGSHAGHGIGRGGDFGTGEGGVVRLDSERRQAIGVRTAPVTKQHLKSAIRSAGRVAYDETRRAEISLKFSGWVREIHVDYPGKFVRAGDPLLSVYSPELLAAQQEYLSSLEGVHGDSLAAGGRDLDLAAAARQRLLLWDIAPAQLDAIARSRNPIEAVPIVAPVGGVVVEKNVVRGSAFMAGQTLYKIAPVDPVWVVASVYQYELPLIREGMVAAIQTPFLAQQSRSGRVAYINPYLDPETRTGEVRLEVSNPRGDLKPGMFVDVVLESDLGERLAVPESAILYAGDRRVVFVDLGDDRLAPRDVTIGPKAGSYYEVLAGLKAGEIVVTSGNFLIAAESKLKSAATGF